MFCPLCKKMEYHLIEHQETDFTQRLILFFATCQGCVRTDKLQGEETIPFSYKCSYRYFSEMVPLEDVPCRN